MRHVPDRMPDRGKRGKDIAILQMGRDAYRKLSKIRNCVTGNDQAVLAHSGLVVARSQVPRPATRSELIRTAITSYATPVGQFTPYGCS